MYQFRDDFAEWKRREEGRKEGREGGECFYLTDTHFSKISQAILNKPHATFNSMRAISMKISCSASRQPKPDSIPRMAHSYR